MFYKYGPNFMQPKTFLVCCFRFYNLCEFWWSVFSDGDLNFGCWRLIEFSFIVIILLWHVIVSVISVADFQYAVILSLFSKIEILYLINKTALLHSHRELSEIAFQILITTVINQASCGQNGNHNLNSAISRHLLLTTHLAGTRYQLWCVGLPNYCDKWGG